MSEKLLLLVKLINWKYDTHLALLDICLISSRIISSNFIRFYLGALESSNDGSDIGRSINPTMLDVARNVDFMKSYTEWLERNEKELQVMLYLDDFYQSPKIEFSEDELKWMNKCLGDINKAEKNILTNKKLQNWFSLQDSNLKVQDVL